MSSIPQYPGDARPEVRRLIEAAKAGDEESIHQLRIRLCVKTKNMPAAALVAAWEAITDVRDDEVRQIIGSN